jgi:hypothetical protein
MNVLWLTPLLAAQFEVYKLILFALLMLGGTIVKKISEARERAERSKTAANAPVVRNPPVKPPAASPQADKTQAARPRDNQFRNEIEVFLEEVGRRRSPNDPQRGATGRGTASAGPPTTRPTMRPQPAKPAPRPSASANPAKAEPPKAAPQAGPPRPGAEIASRKAPVSDDLGAQIRAHLSQYLESSRLSERAQTDLGNAVELAVREHLGATVTRGATGADPVVATAQSVPLLALLRNPAGLRTAILVNEILERPKCLRRKP